MIDKRSDRLKNFLIQCCYWYYVKGEPLIKDPLFDSLLDELKGMEKAFGADKNSPTQMIWGDREDQYKEPYKSPTWITETPLDEYERMPND